MTTVNIQHVESLNDVLGSFAHVRVRETVPDKVFEDAEIELIDLLPEDLIERLEAGKGYGPGGAQRVLDPMSVRTASTRSSPSRTRTAP